MRNLKEEAFDSPKQAYRTIVDALNYLETNGEDPTNENLQDGGPLVIEGNGSGIYWDFDNEVFFLREQ